MQLDVLVFYVPIDDTQRVLERLFETGAGSIGEYEHCAFVSRGTGQFRPIGDANPTIGQLGELEFVEEDRVEVTFPRVMREKIIAALRKAHPYEEPAFHVVENAAS